jgi:hypothetical protein
LSQYVPAPLKQMGSLVQVQVLAGGAPVQASWVGHIVPPLMGYTPQPPGTSREQVAYVVAEMHALSLPNVHEADEHTQLL